jgi:hypothetical protein
MGEWRECEGDIGQVGSVRRKHLGRCAPVRAFEGSGGWVSVLIGQGFVRMVICGTAPTSGGKWENAWLPLRHSRIGGVEIALEPQRRCWSLAAYD